MVLFIVKISTVYGAELFLTRYVEGCLFFNSSRYISRSDFVEKLIVSVDFFLGLSNEEISFSARR